MSPRAFVLLLLLILILVLVLYTVNGRAMTREHIAVKRIEGIGVSGWHARAVANRRMINHLRRALLSRPSVEEALALASATYGVSYDLLRRRAWCESRLDPLAESPTGAMGLMQFLGSTWRTTPYRNFSVWSPYASAFAGAWMQARGRSGEWVCR